MIVLLIYTLILFAIFDFKNLYYGYLQVRPLNDREREEGQRVCVYNDEATKQIVLAVRFNIIYLNMPILSLLMSSELYNCS